MFKIAWYDKKRFFQGKLLRDPFSFTQKTATAVGIGSYLMGLITLAKIPLWSTIIVSSLIAGALMPALLKDFNIR